MTVVDTGRCVAGTAVTQPHSSIGKSGDAAGPARRRAHLNVREGKRDGRAAVMTYDERREMALEAVRHYRRMLELHANDPATGTCPICYVRQCVDWRTAFDRIAIAGEVMAEPGRWDELHTARNQGAP
jgi:hypothetical protein